MAPGARRRILVAVEPIVVEGALAVLLSEAECAEVVQFHRASTEELAVHYDAAIVTAGLPHEVLPEVLITLPDTEGGDGMAHVVVEGASRSVSVGTLREVLELLAEHFPDEIPALKRLAGNGTAAPVR